MEKFQGTIEELGMSIFMQGSHQLVGADGKLIALLQSAGDIDLNAYLSKKVEVSGSSSPSVEGGSIIVSVSSISPL